MVAKIVTGEMRTMQSVFSIADEILRIAKRHKKTLTPLQLMKLVYLSYGWYFGLTGRKLFIERIEAWKYGPIIPDLYRATKKFRRNHIPMNLIDDKTAVDNETSQFLEQIFKNYGFLNGIALSQLTHEAGSPWDVVYSNNSYGVQIPDDLIKEYYQTALNNRGGYSTTA